MSRANPKKAMAALLPLTVRAEADGRVYEVRPMTLGMWAALERISSPLVTGAEVRDTLEIIPSLYLLSHDPREVFRGNIVDLAMAWADEQPVSALEAIKAACDRQICVMTDVIPEADQKKKNRTDGSPRSSTGRQRPTTGVSMKSFGKCRSAQSRSFAGKSGLRMIKSSR
jgi:hypothetical protein